MITLLVLKKSSAIAASALALSLALACTPSASTSPGGTGTPAGAQPGATTQQSVKGQQVYAQSCASCHGQQGEGVTGPALVGSGAGIKRYGDAQSLYNFISTSMPLNAPGSLSSDDYWAVEAYILQQNGLLQGKTLGPGTVPPLTFR